MLANLLVIALVHSSVVNEPFDESDDTLPARGILLTPIRNPPLTPELISPIWYGNHYSPRKDIRTSISSVSDGNNNSRSNNSEHLSNSTHLAPENINPCIQAFLKRLDKYNLACFGIILFCITIVVIFW